MFASPSGPELQYKTRNALSTGCQVKGQTSHVCLNTECLLKCIFNFFKFSGYTVITIDEVRCKRISGLLMSCLSRHVADAILWGFLKVNDSKTNIMIGIEIHQSLL